MRTHRFSPRRNQKPAPGLTSAADARTVQELLLARKQTLAWLLTSPDGLVLLDTLARLPLGDALAVVGLAPATVGTPQVDEALSSTVANAVQQQLKQWEVPGHLEAARAIATLGGMVWNFAHAGSEEALGLCHDLASGMKLPGEMGEFVEMELVSGLMATLDKAGRRDPRYVYRVEVVHCDAVSVKTQVYAATAARRQNATPQTR